MHTVKQRLADALAGALDADVSARDIEEPDEFGDLAYPVMRAAAEKDANPRELAGSVAADIAALDIVADVSVAGPGYLNIDLDRERYAALVEEALSGDQLGVPQRDGSVLLEFSSPNVAKPMHVGHFRNNALGDSLQRILSFVGYDVTSENWLGDWGTQYGKLIYAYKQFGSAEAFEEAPMEHMYELYVKFHDEMEDNKELEEKGRAWAEKIETGDDEAVELWTMFRDASIAYHKQDYERMGVSFDRWTGESQYVDKATEVLEDGIEQGVFTEDPDGSVSISFADDDLPSIVVQKADGTSLYLTRDLATLRDRKEADGFDHNLYVVGSEQRLHFQQLFRAADRLGYDTAGCEHVSYGLLDLPEGSMSSRAGRIVRLSDLLDKAEAKAAEKLEESDRVTADDTDIAASVGIGAVTYATLSVSRTKKITFTWDTILSLDGDSGPYLQYANTRAKSILAKADQNGTLQGNFDDAEHRLLKELARFPEAVEQAAEKRDPATLATALTQLCDTFNSFYHSCPVLQADSPVTVQRRLRLVELFVAVTDTGLDLLGIDPLDRM